MHKALEEFNRLRAERNSEPISVGIGINSGPVIAGAIGSSQTLQYTVIGDAVNVASRLCDVARPGEVLISQSTMDLVAELVEVESRDSMLLKGKSEALPVYLLTGMRDIEIGDRPTAAVPTSTQ